MPWSFYNSNGKLIDGVIDGSITNAKLADDAVGADELAENAVVDASIASGALIAFSKLANLTDGNILVGNGSNVPTSVNPTGDVDIANDGTISLNSTAISGFDAKTSVADADTLLIGDSAASNALKKMTKANLVAGLGGANFKVGSFYVDSHSIGDNPRVESGLGFTPKAVMFLATQPVTAGESSIGFDDGTTAVCIENAHAQAAGSWEVWTDRSIRVVHSSGNTFNGEITALASGQFSVTWSTAGSPSGRIYILYLAMG